MKTNRGNFVGRTGAVIRAALAVALLTAAGTVAAQNIKLLTSWAVGRTLTVEEALKIINAELPKRTGGKVKLTRFGPEVVPPFEQLEPVSSGSFDMLYTHPAYHGGATGIGMMMDTVNPDLDRRRSSGIWDWIDRYYQEAHNLKVLSITAGTGFHLMLREPIGPSGDIKGRKIRSNPAYDALIRELGGSPVTFPVPQIYTGLQKGLVDGTAFPLNSMLKNKFYEVVKYMLRPSFGRSTNLWLMNVNSWKKLDAATQKALLDIGRVVEKSIPWASEKLKLEEEEGMIEKGVRYTYLNDERAQRIEELFNKGIWARGQKVSGAKAAEFAKLIQEKGMAAR